MQPEPLPQLLSMLELTSRQVIRKLMPIILLSRDLLLSTYSLFKHPVSCCWSYKHRCLTTSVYGIVAHPCAIIIKNCVFLLHGGSAGMADLLGTFLPLGILVDPTLALLLIGRSIVLPIVGWPATNIIIIALISQLNFS